MFRTKLMLTGLAAVTTIGGQTAIAQAKSGSASVRPFITDTLAPGGSSSVLPQGFRFITDTLAPGGGTSEVEASRASGFDWGDAGIGAGVMAGLMLALQGSRRVAQGRGAVAV